MTTQAQTDRFKIRQHDLIILGIGLTIGVVAGLPMLLLLLDNWLRGDASLLNSLVFTLDWVPGWIRGTLIQEARLMGWPLAGETSAYWYMSRGAGLIGYLLLWGATTWGLAVSTKVAKDLIPAPFAASLHEFLSLAALASAGFHALALLGDRYIDFGPIGVIYPFAASYQPGWVGLGQLGFYLSAVLSLSFYVRKHIGQNAWRLLHLVSFFTFMVALFHGIASGTGCWPAICKYHLHDPGHNPNEGSCGEAKGAVPDDRFPDRLHKDGEGMPTMQHFPEYGG